MSPFKSPVHCNTTPYEDLVQWGNSRLAWVWRDLNGRRILDQALDTIALTTEFAVPR